MRLPVRLTIVIALAAAGCAGSQPEHHSASLELEAQGGRASVSLTSEAVDSVIAALMGGDVSCSATLDAGMRDVLTTLERRGSRARVTIRGEDGRLDARRRGGTLELAFVGDDAGRLDIEAPWGVAECLLGRATTLGEALAGHRRPSATLRLRPADGEPLRLTVSLD